MTGTKIWEAVPTLKTEIGYWFNYYYYRGSTSYRQGKTHVVFKSQGRPRALCGTRVGPRHRYTKLSEYPSGNPNVRPACKFCRKIVGESVTPLQDKLPEQE